MRRKPMMPASPKPHRCIILSVDSGKTSGFSVWNCGARIVSGVCKPEYGAIMEVCDMVAKQVNPADPLPVVFVSESWDVGGRMNPATVGGMGAAWGAWRVIVKHRFELPDRRIVRFVPREWRYVLFGKGSGHTRDAWKRIAVAWVKARYGIDVTDDEAESLCMGAVGTRAGEVGAALPKRPRRPPGGR